MDACHKHLVFRPLYTSVCCRATKNPKKYRVLLDEQTLERAWALWQATPLIGTIDVPMHARLPQNMNFLTKGSKTASTSRLPQYCWFGKMWDMATNEPNQLRLQAPTTGDKVRLPFSAWHPEIP